MTNFHENFVRILNIIKNLVRSNANFKNSLPPHLQPEAKIKEYLPGSGQSRFYVASHSEFSSLTAGDIQKILHQQIILVHGNPIDYNYDWDLESFSWLYDVDKMTTMHGENGKAFVIFDSF